MRFANSYIAVTFAIIASVLMSLNEVHAADFDVAVKPLLTKYCSDCHSGETPNGDVDFSAIQTEANVVDEFHSLERAIEHLKAKTMPPADEEQPTEAERLAFYEWYTQYLAGIDARPADFKPRRLSVNEYRNTLRSVFGFDLQVAVIEAEQTRSERSMVIKLLPIDPPGRSRFKNDTHRNPLSQVAWDQYSYLADAALEQLFSPRGRESLAAIVGPIENNVLTADHAKTILSTFRNRTRRRPTVETSASDPFGQKQGTELVAVLKFELKTLLMSPAFLYRGLLATSESTGRQFVDDFELAERLSYFLWADMPDQQLQNLASDGVLSGQSSQAAIASEVDRMLASPKAASLAQVFATEWLTIDEIEHVTDNLPQMLAMKSQPVDFMNYLFTENRPLLEFIDSQTTFINPHTAKHYGRDSKQMKRSSKARGIEVMAYDNQKVVLNETQTRGGILTMPGVLAMNQGPIQRGTWMLERVLGQELPEPPANVGQVPPNKGDAHLSFRERFAQHRSNPSCAVCHDKIDPLGFAMQEYDKLGSFMKSKSYKPSRRDVRLGKVEAKADLQINTSGKLPTGETFDDVAGLKQILQTSQRKVVIRNIVERTMSYALCRQLKIYDRPTIESITEDMDSSNATWRDLFVAIANSVPFKETMITD